MDIDSDPASPHPAFTALAPAPPALLTINETARSLRLCRESVYRLIRSGELQSIKIGNSRRVPRLAIEEYVFRKMTAAS